MSYGIKRPLRTAVFISGSGSTLQALLEVQHQFQISLVVSSQKSALGLLKAQRFGVPSFLFSREKKYPELQSELQKFNIERIVLAGYMKILPEDFINLWQDRIVNIHPSLLPAYPGLNSALRNWKDKASMGVSLHHVTAQMDEGPLMLKQKSLSDVQKFSFLEAETFLRRTEQHLLRELAVRWN